ncbi:hypothetical protein BLA60_10245 [Actinophytocola xinjiangensis]|uniref:Integral membrane protein n=1 Tax=Actinophytocola xinjiangensis TaxID=485602 RepID=A0A7Z1B0C7_9PSEU|nr:hypothetical protein [Actinophytocola xinjiangensis]OLF12341.1 hypothetical protein BLA60_10245 [Actinophytocola xinjiangensis]
MTAYGAGPGQPNQYPGQPQYPGQQNQQQYRYPGQQYPGQPGPPGQPPGRVNPAVLVGVSLWRIAIIACALYGFSDATGWEANFEGLSQQASLATAIVYLVLLIYPVFTGGRRHEPASPWLRGATTVMLLLVAGTFFGIMGGGLEDQPFEHIVTPAIVFVDWLFVGRNQAAAKWWHPLTWIAFPLAYFVYFLTAGVYEILYDFLNPDNDEFAMMVVGLLGGVIILGYLLFGLGRIKGAVSAQRQSGPYPPQPSAYTAPEWTR